MNELMTNETINLEQLPAMKANLQEIAKEIDKKTELAMSLVCTEETKAEVKKTRADLNKQFKELEEQRKKVKAVFLAPYEDFEKVYKECVTDKFKPAIADLGEKIAAIDDDLKAKKEQELKDYFEEQNTVSWLHWADMGINVTLSASSAKLKEDIDWKIKQIQSDLEIIDMQEDRDETLLAYQKCRNLAQSIEEVKDRKAQLMIMAQKAAAEHEAKVKRERETREQETPKQEEVKPEPVKDDPMCEVVFKVTTPYSKLAELVQYMKAQGIAFEQQKGENE